MPIPKLVHQFWTSPEGQDIPPDVKPNMASIRSTHPDYEVRLWKLDDVRKALSQPTMLQPLRYISAEKDRHDGGFFSLDFIDAVMACRFPSMQSDLIRFALVYWYGGFWSDLKNRFLSSFMDELIHLDQPVFPEHPHIAGAPPSRDRYCSAFFGAPPRHPLILACIKDMCSKVHARDEKGGIYNVASGSMVVRVIRNHTPPGGNPPIHVMRVDDTWNVLMKRVAASYNAGDKHWSVRQKTESLYF